MQKKAQGNSHWTGFNPKKLINLVHSVDQTDLSGLRSIKEVHEDHVFISLIVVCDFEELTNLLAKTTTTVVKHQAQGYVCVSTANKKTWKELGYDI